MAQSMVIYQLICFTLLLSSMLALGQVTNYHDGQLTHPSDVHTVMNDIALTPQQLLVFKNGGDVSGANNNGVGYAASPKPFHRWPNAVIPYEIDCSLELMPHALEAIKTAIANWEKATCIRFVARTTEKDYVQFFRGTHCWSNLGRIGGKNKISVGDGCEYENVMTHEIGHTLGFWHEQSRKDRDNHVRIEWQNIMDSLKSAFKKINNTDSLGVPYDYGSIMHYRFDAFTANGNDTITPLFPVTKQPYINISQSDALQVSRMYNCPAVLIKRLQTGRRRRSAPATSSSNSCVDTDDQCKNWAKAGYCGRVGDYVYNNCPISCRLPRCRVVCVDKHHDCPVWKSWGHCQLNPTVMQDCAKSCRPWCQPDSTVAPATLTSTTTVPSTTAASYTTPSNPSTPYTGPLPTTSTGSIRLGHGVLCLDRNDQCPKYASWGHCTSNPRFMERYCMVSCNVTSCDKSIPKPPGRCADPLGLAFDGKSYGIPNHQIKATSSLKTGNWTASAHNARLYLEDDHDSEEIGSWCVESWKDFGNGAYVEVDLGRARHIRYIATQGRFTKYERVDKFKISYSKDGVNFSEYNISGQTTIFDGNCDHFTPILNEFTSPVYARHVRYHPVSANYPCVRMEFYGC